MAIAEHAPGKLYKRNKGLTKMSKGQLHEFASTKEKGLPKSMNRAQAIKSAMMKRQKGKHMPAMKKASAGSAIAAKLAKRY